MHVKVVKEEQKCIKSRRRWVSCAREYLLPAVLEPDFVIAAESTPFQIISCHNILTLYNTG
jgi:hypothetical protein